MKILSWRCQLLSLLAMLLALTACTTTSVRYPERDPNTITRTEAEQLLQLAEQYAQKEDLKGFCSLGGASFSSNLPMCERQLTSFGGWAGVPTSSPRIVDGFVVLNYALPGGGTGGGGYVLVLEGTDGLGQSFRHELFVIALQEAGPLGTGIGLAFPYYWVNSEVSKGPSTPGQQIRATVIVTQTAP
ncbi:MAG: hypothetical protein MUD01_09650 [Chloroflexaceae bacterium]|nr:hypothetical protein [Chloroflexaceae bacterium]